MLKFLAALLLMGALIILGGCHFVGDPQGAVGPSGFFGGLWDGTVLLFSVVMTCFTNVQIVEPDNVDFLYKIGYAIGTLFLAWNVGVPCGILSLILYLLPY